MSIRRCDTQQGLRNLRLALFSLLFLLSFLPTCNRSGGKNNDIVAYLGKKPITLENLADTARLMGFSNLASQSPVEWLPAQRQLVFQEAVQNMILTSAGKKMKITVNREDLEHYLHDHFSQKQEDMEKFGKQVLFLEKTEKALEPAETINASDVHAFYREHPALFKVPEQAIVDHIVVAKQEEAVSIRDALLKGSSFSRLARLESLGTEAFTGGRMKPFSRGTLPPPFDSVFSMKPGEISDVLSSPYGYHIFRLDKINPKHTVSLGQAKKWIREQLVEEERKRFLSGWMSRQLKQTPLKILPSFSRIFSPVISYNIQNRIESSPVQK